MRKLCMSIFFILVILVGCSNDEAYQNALAEGIECIKEEEYQEATSAFELALQEKEDDEKATNLLFQTNAYEKALFELEEGNLKKAKKQVNDVMEIEEGSEILIERAEKLLTVITEHESKLTELVESYESALGNFKKKDFKQANKLIKSILKNDLDDVVYEEIKKDTKSLKKEIKIAIEQEEKAEQLRKEKEQAAREAEEQKRLEKERVEQERAEKAKAEQERKMKEEAEKEKVAKAKEESNGGFTLEKAKAYAEEVFKDDEDIGFGVYDRLEYENGRPYYMGRIVNIEMQEAGGTGTIGHFKVFEDGTVIY